MAVITVRGYRCERCGHTWANREPVELDANKELPVACPNSNCRSPYWNVPRRVKELVE